MKLLILATLFASTLGFSAALRSTGSAMLDGTADDDRVKALPDMTQPLPANMYAGYVTVDPSHGRAMYYVYTESQRSPSKDPLVLWLTGGPGCSSVSAFFTEQGMIGFDAQGLPKTNPHSWNKVVNMVFLESPAGVGFSYSNTTADYVTGDKRAAEDTYAFLQGFLAKHPNLKGRDFWVTGESYAGHYVPEIVDLIIEMNAQQPADKIIPVKGFMVGNPWTDPEVEAFGVTDNWIQRFIVSDKVSDTINTKCTYRDITHWIINNVTAGARITRPQHKPLPKDLTDSQKECFDALYDGSIKTFGDIDILSVFSDVCVNGTKALPFQPNVCSDGQSTTYLNRLDVQQAMHVRNAPQPWSGCSSVVEYNQEDTQTSVLPLYQKFLAMKNLRILVYSGDTDAIVPTTATHRWVKKLGLPIVHDTHPWFVDTNGLQVGGFAVEHEGLTFTTVRGAGHLVPQDQPARSFWLFDTFLHGRKI